jgi:hypothetical protein
MGLPQSQNRGDIEAVTSLTIAVAGLGYVGLPLARVRGNGRHQITEKLAFVSVFTNVKSVFDADAVRAAGTRHWRS